MYKENGKVGKENEKPQVVLRVQPWQKQECKWESMDLRRMAWW